MAQHEGLLAADAGRPRATFFTAFVFNVNFIMGSGILAIPHGFYEAGYLLALAVLVVVTVLSFITISWNFESQLRLFMLADAFRRNKLRLVSTESSAMSLPTLRGQLPGYPEATDSSAAPATIDSPPACKSLNDFVEVLRGSQGGQLKYFPSMEEQSALGETDWGGDTDFDSFESADYLELNDIIFALGGKWASFAWNFVFCVFQLSVLWVFLTVLSSTSVLGIPLPGMTEYLQCNTNDPGFSTTGSCMSAIRIYFVIYSAVLTMLILKDWRWMPVMQKIFGVVVYIGVGIIAVTCIVAMAQHPYPGAKDQVCVKPPCIQDIKPAKIGGFGVLFGVLVFALLCHSGTSLILRQMPSLASVKRVFAASFTAVMVMYCAMALVVIFYIGSETDKVATMDWSVYREWGAHGWIGSAIGNIVLFFPVFSVTAGFVLRARSLSDAVETMLAAETKEKLSSLVLRHPYQKSGNGEVHRFQSALRVVVVLLALTLCQISYKFDKALVFAGLAGFCILFFFPMICQLRSRRLLLKLGFTPSTPYDNAFSGNIVVIVVGVIGVVSFVYYIYSQVVAML